MIQFGVHVHPGTRQANVGGSYNGELTVHVRARAIDGAATVEALELLAHSFDVRTSAVRCVRGSHSRSKLIRIDGDEGALSERLRLLLGDRDDNV